MNASQKRRLEKVEKLVAIPSAPPTGEPFRIVSVIDWPEDAQRAYDAGDEATCAELMERFAGVPRPEPSARKRRRPLVQRPRRIVMLVVCGVLDEAEAVDDDDEPASTAPPPAEPAPVVEPPGSNPTDVVGLDRFGNPETRLDRDARLAAEAALVAAGQDVPSPEDGRPRFNKWGELVSGTHRPPAQTDTGYYVFDRSGRRVV